MADTYRGPPRPHPTGYAYPPPEPDPLRYDRQSFRFDVLKTIGAMLVAGAGVVWWGSQQFSDVKYGLREVNSRLTSLSTEFGERFARSETEARARSMQRFTRADHQLFCARTEQINPNWKCGPIDDVPTLNGTAIDRFGFTSPTTGWDLKK